MSVVWEVRIPSDVRAVTGGMATEFVLDGVASTRLALFGRHPVHGDQEIARWSFEVAADSSPGCHFHTQVKGDFSDRLFPPTLSIPRLPGILVTPIDALDFLLGEVFQDSWAENVARDSADLRTWAAIQRHRLANVLEWQRQQVINARGAVWLAIKRAKPRTEQLLPRN
jgi:hypothetical protein